MKLPFVALKAELLVIAPVESKNISPPLAVTLALLVTKFEPVKLMAEPAVRVPLVLRLVLDNKVRLPPAEVTPFAVKAL